MKMMFLVALIPCILCVSGAIVLMFLGKDGWGWLLFLAIIFSGVEVSQRGEK